MNDNTIMIIGLIIIIAIFSLAILISIRRYDKKMSSSRKKKKGRLKNMPHRRLPK